MPVAEALRKVDVSLPAAWRADDDADDAPTPFRLPGVDMRPEWWGTHEDGRSKLVVFSVRLSSKATMESLRTALRRDLMAEPGHASGDALAWVSQFEGEYVPAIMRTPSAGGHPLVWLARLPQDTVPDRMPEILAALEAAEWQWA